ncbi:MAG: hypothetical protein QF578_02430 [Alphaproteobacteria bacterium]|nr:hypothetical protein [Alphaproteobacteria bacterium]
MTDDGLLDGGADGQMLADFGALADATGPSGEPKFPPRPLAHLARFLVGRGGGPNRDAPLFELCHLVNAVDAAGGTTDGRWGFFLGQDLVRARSCRQHLREMLSADGWCRGGFEMTADGVSITYADDAFSLSFGRMPFLVALFEFLATMENYQGLNDGLDVMVQEAGSRRAVQDAANRIAAELRQYRNRHLDRGGNDEAFATIQGFMHGRVGEEQGDRWRLDDAAILTFWRQHNLGACKTYRKAFEHFADFLDAVTTASARQAGAAAAPLGADRETGEVEPDDLSHARSPLDDLAAWRDPLPLLDQGPAAEIKFFTKSGERDPLAPLMAFGPFAVRLPLAFLRYLSFGAVQTQISQGLRIHPGQPVLVDHLSCAEAESYPERRDLYGRLLEHLGRMQKATYYALRQARAEAVGDNVMALGAAGDGRMFERARRDLADEDEFSEAEQAALEDEGAREFRRISRRGFDEEALADEDRQEGFRIGAGVLYAVGNVLSRYLGELGKLDGDGAGLASLLEADRATFAGEFGKLYGVTDD